MNNKENKVFVPTYLCLIFPAQGGMKFGDGLYRGWLNVFSFTLVFIEKMNNYMLTRQNKLVFKQKGVVRYRKKPIKI